MEDEPQDEPDFVLPKTDPVFQMNFTRPKTTLVDKKENVVEVLPKVQEKIPDFEEEEEKAPYEADTFDFEFSDALNKLFPDVRNHVKPEEISATKPTIDMDELTKILMDTTKDEPPPQLDFFTGGENKKFVTRARGEGLSSNSNDFVDFLQGVTCSELMKKNKLKIHIDTGNIYYDNSDTNKSIYSFLLTHKDDTKKLMDFEFIYSGSYEQHFNEYLVQINKKTDDARDVLTNESSKFLFYHYNDLLFDVNLDPFHVRHSRISDDEFAIETIWTENWQYFIKRILEVCQSNRIEYNIDQSGIQESQLVQRYIKNLTICKQVYQECYSKIGQYFAAMLKMLPSTMITRIDDNFFIDFNKKIDNIEDLNRSCEFYHIYGRFPGAADLSVLPRPQIPHFLNGNEMISFSRLFEKSQWTKVLYQFKR